MKILLTGATGFVGSHILDALVQHSIPTTILVRGNARKRIAEQSWNQAERVEGSLENLPSLERALSKHITHVIHCAGCTKAIHSAEYFAGNQLATRNLVDAINRTKQKGSLSRFIHISSLAASRSANQSEPALESDSPKPLTEYGKSKLAAEKELERLNGVETITLRPAAVYGPRDSDFLLLFQVLKKRVDLLYNGGAQQLSLVYVQDVASAVMASLLRGPGPSTTCNIAHGEVVTVRGLSDQICSALGVVPRRFNLPGALLWMVCLLQQTISLITRKPNILNLQKFPELTAPGWVCSVEKAKQELGFSCQTNLAEGVQKTLRYYQQEGLL